MPARGRPSGAAGAPTVLVVEPDPACARQLGAWLEGAGMTARVVATRDAALATLAGAIVDAAFVRVAPGAAGAAVRVAAELTAALRARDARLPIVLLADEGDDAAVLLALARGADDFLMAPGEQKLLATARLVVALGRLRARVATLVREVAAGESHGIVGRSAAIRRLLGELDRIAGSEATVLVHGESGTGKELVAGAIHARSPRHAGPFVAVNCAAIPESLQESELFGHEKGAFTGATARHLGTFERAHGGTIFLDEVGELSLAAQAKLLRVLQERTFQRVGGREPVRADFRVIAATHRDLAAAVRAGRFREDLWFRLAVVELSVPPLRARDGDAVHLAHHFLARFDAEAGTERSFALDALAAMVRYPWPGNVRELQNAVHRALVLATGPLLTLDDFPARIRAALDGDGAPAGGVGERAAAEGPAVDASVVDAPAGDARWDHAPSGEASVGRAAAAPPGDAGDAAPAGAPALPAWTLEALERRAIEEALARHAGNVSGAARALGIGRTTLYRKLAAYQLPG